MINNGVKRKRGRPPTHPVDRLKTRIWFNLVKHKSGLPSAYMIEMFLDGDEIRRKRLIVKKARKWDFYRDGLRVPNDKRKIRNSVEQAESHFLGTAKWFRSPIWPFLRGERFDQKAIVGALQSLQPEIVEILFYPKSNTSSLTRLKPFNETSKSLLVEVGGLDALAAAVLLVFYAEEISSLELRNISLKLYNALQPKLMQMQELVPFIHELFFWVNKACPYWLYLSGTQRVELTQVEEQIITIESLRVDTK